MAFQTKTFNRLWNELSGEFGNVLPPEVAKTFTRKAFLAVCDEREWSFLYGEGLLLAPGAINVGSATFTRLSNQVVVDATLQTALDAQDLVLVTRMAIRAGASGSSTISVYQIYGWDTATLTLTLDRPYLGATETFTPFIFRQYYLPPSVPTVDGSGMIETSDFRNFLVVKPISTTNRKNLTISQRAQELDQRDPLRSITGEPTHLFPAPTLPNNFPGASSNGNLLPGTPRFELWPMWTSTGEKIYKCLYQRRGESLVDDRGGVNSVIPFPLDPEIVMLRAKIEASLWADRNKGAYKQFQATNWMNQIQVLNSQYADVYMRCRRLDEDLVDKMLSGWESGENAGRPGSLLDYDPEYAQTHATAWETYGSFR